MTKTPEQLALDDVLHDLIELRAVLRGHSHEDSAKRILVDRLSNNITDIRQSLSARQRCDAAKDVEELLGALDNYHQWHQSEDLWKTYWRMSAKYRNVAPPSGGEGKI